MKHCPESSRFKWGAVALLGLSALGCAPRGTVEGDVRGVAFHIQDGAPIARWDTQLIVLIAEIRGPVMHQVVLTIPPDETADGTFRLGSEAALSIHSGVMEQTDRGDGRKVIMLRDPTRDSAADGWLETTLQDDVLVGNFAALLVDGGAVEGHFEVPARDDSRQH